MPAATPVFTAITPATRVMLASVDSPPMSELVALTNAPSDNFFAEMLLKDLGGDVRRRRHDRRRRRRRHADGRADFQLEPRLDDGSGLSRFDRTTAAQVVSLLEQQASDQPFVASLAVAGVSGTMKQEMLGTPAVGNCRGKTGTLADVANLVGYCTARNGDQLAFAVFENRLGNADAGHLTEDAIGATLAEYDPLTGAG